MFNQNELYLDSNSKYNNTNFWTIDYQNLLLLYIMNLNCLLDLNIIHKRKKIKTVQLNIKSWLVFFIAFLNAIQLVTSTTTPVQNNNSTVSALNSNINSSQLARLLNIPVDQLNILLLKQIKSSQPQHAIQSQLQSQPQPQTNILIQKTNPLVLPNLSPLSSNVNNSSYTNISTSITLTTNTTNTNQKLALIDKTPTIRILNSTNNQNTAITSSFTSSLSSSNLITNSTANVLLNKSQSTSSSSLTTNNNCNSVSQYWTGFRCACRVGYCYKNGNCEMIMYQNQIIFPSSFNYNYYYSQQRSQIIINQNNVNTPQASISSIKFMTTNNSLIQEVNSSISTSTPINANSSISSSDTGSIKITTSQNQAANIITINNNSQTTATIKSINFQAPTTVTIEQQKLAVICHINQIDNGLGICICKSGYFKFDTNNGTCFKIQTLPQCYGSFYYQYIANMTDFSVKNITCKCYQGNLYSYNNSTICRKCPIGSLWSPQTNSCFVYCGANMRYNQITKSCQCFAGFGKIKSDQCQICQQLNMIFINGYCVKCPFGSFANFINQTCECLNGYQSNDQGVCVKICPNNQILYSISDSNEKFCSCVHGLGISNSTGQTGQCGLCPSSTYPSIGLNICIYCAENQILVNGKQCQCIKGNAKNKYSQCVSCLSLNQKNSNINRTTFLLSDGSCAYCPGNQSYINNTCTCQPNSRIIGIFCIPIICPIYEQLSNNNPSSGCQCVQFYSRNNITQICQLFCQSDEQKAGNVCIKMKCNINQIYVLNKGCICIQGFIKNSFGVCQDQNNFFNSSVSLNSTENIIIQNTRTNTMNINSNSSNNNKSTGSSENVKSNTNSSSLFISNNVNLTQIIININNNNKTSSSNVNGSSNSTKTTIDLTNQTNLTLLIMNFNINNVYLQIQIPFNITFQTQQQMQNFMISNFPDSGTMPASVFCSQTLDNLTRFECLLIYPSGIPNKIFSCNFYYNYKGMHGNQTFKINPLSFPKIQNSLSSTSRLR